MSTTATTNPFQIFTESIETQKAKRSNGVTLHPSKHSCHLRVGAFKLPLTTLRNFLTSWYASYQAGALKLPKDLFSFVFIVIRVEKNANTVGGAVQCIAGGYLGGFRCCVRGVGYSIMFRNALLVSLLRPINYQLGRWKNSLGSRILLGRRVLDFLLHSRPTCGLSELITEFINMTWQP